MIDELGKSDVDNTLLLYANCDAELISLLVILNKFIYYVSTPAPFSLTQYFRNENS